MSSMNISDAQGLVLWNDSIAKHLVPNTIIIILYLVFGIPGNILVLLVYHFRLKDKKEGRYFIPILSILDIFALTITGIFNLTRNYRPVTFPGNWTCKLLMYLSYVSTSTSLLLLNVIAIQRYLMICRPLGRQMSRKWKRILLVVCNTSSVLIYIPVLVLYGAIDVTNAKLGVSGRQCNRLPEYDFQGLQAFNGIGLTITFGNVLLITVLYVLIGKTINSKMKKKETKFSEISETSISIQTGTSSINANIDEISVGENVSSNTIGTNDSDVDVKKTSKLVMASDSKGAKTSMSIVRLTIMFMIISSVGFLAYLPSWIFIIIESNNPNFWSQLSPEAFQICLIFRRMYMINHIANPIIYSMFDNVFRKEMINLLKRLKCYQ